MDPLLVVLWLAIGACQVYVRSIDTPSCIGVDRRRRVPRRGESGRIGWALLWLLGVPIPVLLVLYMFRGCT